MDPFKILGVDESASPDEIRQAFLKLCKQHHPDHGGDPGKFKPIREAYEAIQKLPPPEPPLESQVEPRSMDVTEAPSRWQRSDASRRSRSLSNAAIVVGGVIAAVLALFLLYYGFRLNEIGVTGPGSSPDDRNSLGSKPQDTTHPSESSSVATKIRGSDEPTDTPATRSELPIREPAQSPNEVAPEESIAAKNQTESVGSPGEEPTILEPNTETRPDVPSDESQRAPRELISEVYRSKYETADSPDKKIDIAVDMLNASRDESDPAAQFALLDISRGIAITHTKLRLALRISDELVKNFVLDEMATTSETLSGIVTRFLERGGFKDREVTEIVFALYGTAEEALFAQQFDVAVDLFDKANSVARMADKQKWSARMLERKEEAQAKRSAYEEFQKALSQLASDPEDSAAALVVGRYFCSNADWEKGLTYLAKSQDIPLKLLAADDLRGVAESNEQEGIGDRWWNYATDGDPRFKEMSTTRAGYWYRQVLAGASGLTKRKLQDRLGMIRKATESDTVLPQSDTLVLDDETPTERDKRKSTEVLVAEFRGFVDRTLTELQSLETDAQKQAAIGRLGETFNSALKSHVWTLRFPIVNIVGNRETPSEYTLTLGPPTDIEVQPWKTQQRAVVTLKSAKALRVRPHEDIFVIKGKPFFKRGDLLWTNKSYLFRLNMYGNIGRGYVGLRDFRYRIMRSSPATSDKIKKEEEDKNTDIDSERPPGIVLENSPIDFIPLGADTTPPLSSSSVFRDVYYVVDSRGDRTYVVIHNAGPQPFEVQVDFSHPAGSILKRPGADPYRPSTLNTAPTFVVTWANRRITTVKWNDRRVPPLAVVDERSLPKTIPPTYILPSRSEDPILYRKASDILRAQIEWVKAHRAPEGYILFGEEFIDGHDWTSLYPLRIEYCPRIVFDGESEHRIIGDIARVILHAGIGKDGKERVVVALFRRSRDQMKWEGDDPPSENSYHSTTFVREKRELTPGRVLNPELMR